MSDPLPHRQNLSEISHLFLSSVRDRQTGGSARPVRTPPGQKNMDVSIDLTPEEFARMCGNPAPAPRTAPVTAILASHLNGAQFDRVKAYARHVAAREGRIGFIELDASEFRLMSFAPAAQTDESALGESTPTEGYDLSHVADAINELHSDVEQWLVLLPSPRTPEARKLLRTISRWVLLTTCDHDGVVSGYRTLKGLNDLHRPGEGAPAAPHLSLAVMGDEDADADRVYQKLASVCQQFLHWPIECEPRVTAVDRVEENLIMCVRPTRDKAQMASATQWDIVGSFLASIQEKPALAGKSSVEPASSPMPAASSPAGMRHVADIPLRSTGHPHNTHPTSAHSALPTAPETQTHQAPAMPHAPSVSETFKIGPSIAMQDDVVELADADASAGAILSAVIRHEAGEMLECPVRPPMDPDTRLAVDRQGGLVLLAVSRTGLADLGTIGQAYRWLMENRPLITMAVPQLAICSHQMPRLRLLVDQADLAADTLQPLVHSGNVTVQAYRKLRWGGKTGLLLAAA
jgi:hypothetical protein